MTGRPSSITQQHVDIAAEISALGGALSTIANASNTPLRTIESWLTRARRGEGSELEQSFLRAIQAGQHAAEMQAIAKIIDSRDPRDAQWWLTHHPSTRETWSDAAADRRAERKTMATVLEAMAAAGLPADLEQALILQMQARGLGAQPAPDA